MGFALLLAAITAAIGYVLHRTRIRALEHALTCRTSDEVQSVSSRRDESDLRSAEIAALDRARCGVLLGLMRDLRTPLMMLQSPLQTSIHLRGAANLDDDDLERMMTQARRIQRGIEQMEHVLELDLGSAELSYRTADFVTTMERLIMSLRPLAERKGVTVQFSSDLDALSFAFDGDRIEQAVHGLVERAFDDMAPGDLLAFVLRLDESSSDASGRVVLEIADNGRPVAERYLKLFRTHEGGTAFEDTISDATALSLALAYRFVVLHGGELDIEPAADRGTCARIVLPLPIGSESAKPAVRAGTGEQRSSEERTASHTRFGPSEPGVTDESCTSTEMAASGERITSIERDAAGNEATSSDSGAVDEGAAFDEALPEDIAALLPHGEAPESEQEVAGGTGAAAKQTTVLVVDDHPGTRGYLAYALRRHHNVIEAANGREALDLIKDVNPDLVISDIMMPVMDGTELCRSIKSDESLNHIPIFLVTANAIPTVKMESLESGADDYLVKPFDLEEAVMRINNEIKTRTELRKRYTREVVIKPSDITVTSADEAFVNRAREIIEENIDEGNFGVQELASELGLSPRQLQRRLRDTVDQSPVEFIRTLRLQRAAQLLEAQYGNVSEVAYSVGFTSLSYFAKCFREQFGSTPSDFKSEQAA